MFVCMCMYTRRWDGSYACVFIYEFGMVGAWSLTVRRQSVRASDSGWLTRSTTNNNRFTYFLSLTHNTQQISQIKQNKNRTRTWWSSTAGRASSAGLLPPHASSPASTPPRVCLCVFIYSFIHQCVCMCVFICVWVERSVDRPKITYASYNHQK